MPWELVDALGNRYRLPASLQPAQLHVGGRPRIRFVRGYGSGNWYSVLDGIREPDTMDLVGVLQTDRDEVTIQALLDQLDAAAASAVKLVHLDNYGVPIRQLPLLGALPITTEPDGVDGTFLRVTVPLVPGQADWEAPDESSGPAPAALITYGGQPVTCGGQALAYLAPDPLQLKAGTNVALRLEDDDLFIDVGAGGGA